MVCGGLMRVCVRRVPAMPHNIEVWVDDQPDAFVVNVDENLSAERQAEVLEAAFNMTVEHWHREPNDPHL